MSGLYVMGCEPVGRKISGSVFTAGMLKWSHKTTPGSSSTTIKSEIVKKKNHAGFRR